MGISLCRLSISAAISLMRSKRSISNTSLEYVNPPWAMNCSSFAHSSHCGSWDLYRHKAGFEYVETLEETLTYSISIDKLNDLYKSRIDIANWMRVLQQENFLLLQDIHISRLNLSAQERYEKLIKEYPSIFHRVTLGHIASFFYEIDLIVKTTSLYDDSFSRKSLLFKTVL